MAQRPGGRPRGGSAHRFGLPFGQVDGTPTTTSTATLRAPSPSWSRADIGSIQRRSSGSASSTSFPSSRTPTALRQRFLRRLGRGVGVEGSIVLPPRASWPWWPRRRLRMDAGRLFTNNAGVARPCVASRASSRGRRRSSAPARARPLPSRRRFGRLTAARPRPLGNTTSESDSDIRPPPGTPGSPSVCAARSGPERFTGRGARRCGRWRRPSPRRAPARARPGP